MKNNPKDGQRKGMDPKANDDTLGENTEQTPLAKKGGKVNKDKEKKSRKGKEN